VEAEDSLDFRALQRPRFDDLSRSALLPGRHLFARLEDDPERPRQDSPERLQDAQHAVGDRHVGVVPAGVHHSVPSRGVGDVFRVPDRQSVHVRPEGYGRTGLLAAQVRQQAGSRDSGPHGGPHGTEQFFDSLGGTVLLEAQLRFPVEIAPDLDQLRLQSVA
jgi:hypothetical protein